MLSDNDDPFEITFYTPPQSPSSSIVGSTRAKSVLARRERYSPYALAKRAMYQMAVTYIEPAYVEARVEIIQPAPPLEGLGAVLQPPENGVRAFVRNIFFGAVNIFFGLVACIDFLWREFVKVLA